MSSERMSLFSFSFHSSIPLFLLSHSHFLLVHRRRRNVQKDIFCLPYFPFHSFIPFNTKKKEQKTGGREREEYKNKDEKKRENWDIEVTHLTVGHKKNMANDEPRNEWWNEDEKGPQKKQAQERNGWMEEVLEWTMVIT